MERLKAVDAVIREYYNFGFTFQYGEIKRANCHEAGTWFMKFTFQYGEIKRFLFDFVLLLCHHIYIPVWRD